MKNFYGNCQGGKKMLSNIISWFVVLGLSYLVEAIGLANQGTAFILIYCFSAPILICLFLFISSKNLFGSCPGKILLFIFLFICIVTYPVIFLSFAVSKLFNIEFAIVFQIVTFVACFFVRTNNNN